MENFQKSITQKGAKIIQDLSRKQISLGVLLT